MVSPRFSTSLLFPCLPFPYLGMEGRKSFSRVSVTLKPSSLGLWIYFLRPQCASCSLSPSVQSWTSVLRCKNFLIICLPAKSYDSRVSRPLKQMEASHESQVPLRPGYFLLFLSSDKSYQFHYFSPWKRFRPGESNSLAALSYLVIPKGQTNFVRTSVCALLSY